MTGKHQPPRTADDITDGAEEARFELGYLAPADAFYTFQGYLGERRLLPGRDGPPGADYNTLPDLKPKGIEMLAHYWRKGNLDDLERFERATREGGSYAAFAEAQAEPFYRAWERLKASRAQAPAAP